jgi:hypothetical protein
MASSAIYGPAFCPSPSFALVFHHEAHFRLIARQVLAQPESDDPVEVEARTAPTLSSTIDLNALSQ